MAKTAKHPVAFPRMPICVIKAESLESNLSMFKGYESRELELTTICHGLEVSVNYKDGVFVSMLSSEDGVTGDVLLANVATSLVPAAIPTKGEVTMHAVLTVVNTNDFRRGLTKIDIAEFLKNRLTEGFAPYEEKRVVINPLFLWVDNVEQDIESVWMVIGNMTITGTTYPIPLESVIQRITHPEVDSLTAPPIGFYIRDRYPEHAEAFPSTTFIYDI